MPQKRNFNSVFGAVANLNINRNNTQSTAKNYEIEGLFKTNMINGKQTIVLRFLPNHPDEIDGIPFVENRSHMMQLENGQWFGCDCPKKYNEPCPVCDYNSKVWNKYGRTDAARALVKAKWKPDYYSNVYIVKNDNSPETVGKVYRLKYGRAIMKFITEAMEGRDDAELGRIPGINPFSWYGPNDKDVLTGEEKAGANFVWEMVQGSNGPNYDKSHFSTPRRMCKNVNGQLIDMTDAELDEVESQLYTLKDIEKPKDSIQTYQKICENYRRKSGGEDIMGEFADGSADYTATTNTVAVNDDEIFGAPSAPAPRQSARVVETATMPFDDEPVAPVSRPAARPAPKAAPVPAPQEAEDEDDFFSRLSNG